MQLVSGQGYGTDPKLPPKPPRGPWGVLAWTSVITATGITASNEYFGPVLKPDNGLQPLSWPNGTVPFFTGTGPVFSLPPIVIQGGRTYYRNSSGLLSTTPQTTSSQGVKTNNSSGGGGSGTQTSSNNGGWGNTHTACGTLCI